MITLFNLFIISFFFTHFEPIQDRLEIWIGLLQLKTKRHWLQTIIDSVYIVLSCFKCFSFHLSLIVTFDPILSMFVSFLAYTYMKIIERK